MNLLNRLFGIIMLILAWWLLTGFLEGLRWIFAYLLPFIAQEFARKNPADIDFHIRNEIYY
jgi:thiol:disulfide interchange protein